MHRFVAYPLWPAASVMPVALATAPVVVAIIPAPARPARLLGLIAAACVATALHSAQHAGHMMMLKLVNRLLLCY